MRSLKNTKKLSENKDKKSSSNSESSIQIGKDCQNDNIFSFEKNQKENIEPELNSFYQSGTQNVNERVLIIKENKEELKKKLPSLNTNDILAKNYPKLYSIIKPLQGIRPKKVTLYEVKYWIEELYSTCLLNYSQSLKEQFAKGIENASIQSLPYYVYKFISKKHYKKAIADQTLLNLLNSLDYFKDKDEEVDIFSKFLSEEYNEEDLVFFLFIRSAIEKELKMLFLEKAKDEIKIQHMEERDEIFTVLYINIKTLSKIVATIFASDDEVLVNTFIRRLEPLMEKNVNCNHYNTLTTTQLLKATIEDFHYSRQTYPECKGITSVPFSSSKQNEFFDNVNDDDCRMNSPNNDSGSFGNLINYFTNQPGDKIDNIKAVLLIYLKEKEIMIFFEKYYSGEFNQGFEESASDIREIILKKLFYLLHLVFYEDELSWNSALGIEPNTPNDNFSVLVSLKESLLSVNSISQLNESIIESFCASLLSTPQLLNQISKIINSKRQI